MKKKILKSLFLIIFIVIFFNNIAYALDSQSFVDQVSPGGGDTGQFSKAINVIVGIFQVVAVGVAAIMLIVLAIKYMSSAPNEKAEIKKHAAVYIVGAVMAFAAVGVVQIIKTFSEEIVK